MIKGIDIAGFVEPRAWDAVHYFEAEYGIPAPGIVTRLAVAAFDEHKRGTPLGQQVQKHLVDGNEAYVEATKRMRKGLLPDVGFVQQIGDISRALWNREFPSKPLKNDRDVFLASAVVVAAVNASIKATIQYRKDVEDSRPTT
jgi:hypothetical protein